MADISAAALPDGAPQDAPQDDMFVLTFDGDSARWVVVNRMTGELVVLPGGSELRWAVGISNGHRAFVVSSADNNEWLDDLFRLKVLEKNNTKYIGDFEADQVCSYYGFLCERYDQEVTLNIDGRTCKLRLWRFEHPWDGCHAWWSLRSLHCAAGITGSMSTSEWAQTWWPWWLKWLPKLNIAAAPHLRRVVPGRCREASVAEPYFGVDCRLFEEPSTSPFALVALLCKWCNAGRHRKAQHTEENARRWRDAFGMIFDLLIKPNLPATLKLYMDKTVICTPSLPVMGENDIELPISEGFQVDLMPLNNTVLGRQLFHVLGHNRRLPIIGFMLSAERLGLAYKFLLVQLVHRVAAILDAAVRSMAQEKGPLDNVDMDGSGAEVDHLESLRHKRPQVDVVDKWGCL